MRLLESDYRKALDVLYAAGEVEGSLAFPEPVLLWLYLDPARTDARFEFDRSDSDFRERDAYEKLGVRTSTGAVAATFGRKHARA